MNRQIDFDSRLRKQYSQQIFLLNNSASRQSLLHHLSCLVKFCWCFLFSRKSFIKKQWQYGFLSDFIANLCLHNHIRNFITNFHFRLPKTTFLIAKINIMAIENVNLHSGIAILENCLFGNSEQLTLNKRLFVIAAYPV